MRLTQTNRIIFKKPQVVGRVVGHLGERSFEETTYNSLTATYNDPGVQYGGSPMENDSPPSNLRVKVY